MEGHASFSRGCFGHVGALGAEKVSERLSYCLEWLEVVFVPLHIPDVQRGSFGRCGPTLTFLGEMQVAGLGRPFKSGKQNVELNLDGTVTRCWFCWWGASSDILSGTECHLRVDGL